MAAQPRVFDLIKNVSNTAVDAALVRAFPTLEPAMAQEVLKLLLKRRQAPFLESLVVHYRTFPTAIQTVCWVSDLVPAARRVLASRPMRREPPGEPNHRAGHRTSGTGGSPFPVEEGVFSALNLVRDAGLFDVADQVARQLRQESVAVKKAAGQVLVALTERFLQLPTAPEKTSSEASSATDGQPRSTRREQALCEGLRHALEIWPAHYQPSVLRAALWMAPWLDSVFRKHLSRPASALGHAIGTMIAEGGDPRLASATLLALGWGATSRQNAAQCLENSMDPAFWAEVWGQPWLLSEPDIEEGVRRVHRLACLEQNKAWILDLPEKARCAAPKWVAMTHSNVASKFGTLQFLLQSSDSAVAEAACWAVLSLKGEEATRVLERFLTREPADHPLAVVIQRELARRTASTAVREGSPSTAPDGEGGPSPKAPSETRGVVEGDSVHTPSSQQAAQVAADPTTKTSYDLTAVRKSILSGLKSSRPLDRIRALRLVEQFQLYETMQNDWPRLAQDEDPFVRASAVRLLGRLKTPGVRRILQQAIKDADPRVRANAIEALSEGENRAGMDASLLWDPDMDSRSRANRVAALLREGKTEAGAVLIDMLRASELSERLSALWVVEELGLTSMKSRVESMAQSDLDEQVRRRARSVLHRLSHAKSEAAFPAPAVQAEEGGFSDAAGRRREAL